MPYQSPLHILQSLNISSDELNPAGINRLKKKLMAEFNLVNSVTIAINGTNYTKDEILKTIDNLKDLEHLAGHQYIFEHKELLQWLENPSKIDIPTDEAETLAQTFESDAFVIDILQEALNKNIIYLYHKHRFQDIAPPLSIVELLQNYRKESCYDFIYQELNHLIQTIEQASESPNIKENHASFGYIITPEWTDFLNNLPEALADIRSEYCWCMINYTVACQKKSRQWTYELSFQLNQTLCDKELSDLIAKNHIIYRDNYQNTQKSDASNAWIYWLGYAVLMGLFRLNSCSNHTSSNNFEIHESGKQQVIEQEGVSKLSIPATTFYVLRTQAYQKALTIADTQQFISQKELSKPLFNLRNGTDLLTNLDLNTLTGIDLDTTIQNKQNEGNIEFINNSNYDLLVFRAGCDKNHSFFISKGTKFIINCCSDDIFNFYFGNNWHKMESKSQFLIESRYMYIAKNTIPFEGYFAEKYSNGLPTFYQAYQLYNINPNATWTFEGGSQDNKIEFIPKHITVLINIQTNREDILAQ